MRAHLEGEHIKNARGSSHPAPLVKQNKGKEPIRSEDSDATADDELSSDSSLLLDLSPPKNNVEAESRKKPRVVLVCPSAACPVWCKENSAEKGGSRSAPLKTYPVWLGGAAPSLPFGYPTFGAAPVPYMPASTVIRGHEDMLLSPLGQHILSYEPPRGFSIPPLPCVMAP